jgi:hypothetical protein
MINGGHEEGRSNEGYMGDDGYDPEDDCEEEGMLLQDHEENDDENTSALASQYY